MIRRILRYPYNIAKGTAVRYRVQSRIRASGGPTPYTGARIKDAADNVLGFLEARRHAQGGPYEYLYSARSTRPTLYASVYACMTLALLGKLDRLEDEERHAWAGYFDSFQSEADGLFRDPAIINDIYDDSDWWGARHLALHLVSAYTALGHTPQYPFRFLGQYYETGRIEAWLDRFDWTAATGLENDVDNKIMNIGCLLQYQRDTWNDEQAAGAVSFLQGYLKDRINPDTGMWGTWNLANRHHRSRMVQFAYHLFPLFFYDRILLDHPEKIIEEVLKTQNLYGGFGVDANSSACEDIDSIDILCRLATFVPERRAEIDEALQKALGWVLCNQVDDGGFVFRLYDPFTYGHQEMSSGQNQGAMFPTWFRLLSLAYLLRYFDSNELFKVNLCPGYEF